MEIYKEFVFSAAHALAGMPEGHLYGRLHGHTFQCRISLEGAIDGGRGWITDFAEIEAAISPAREKLDHRNLNDVEGLGPPTLENLARWLWRELKPGLPGLAAVTLRREGNGEGCVYRGELD